MVIENFFNKKKFQLEEGFVLEILLSIVLLSDFEANIGKSLIEFSHYGLVDSIKFIINKIFFIMESNDLFFNLTEIIVN